MLCINFKKLISCVLPGVLLVLAILFLFTIALIAVDFPALDLPTKAISCPTSSGKSLAELALLKILFFLGSRLMPVSIVLCKMHKILELNINKGIIADSMKDVELEIYMRDDFAK